MCVYLHAFETGFELRAGLLEWIDYYNAGRPHSGIGGRTADEAYGVGDRMRLAARQLPGPSLARPVNCPTVGVHLNLRGTMGVVVNDAEAGDLAGLPPAPCYAAEARQALLRATAGA